jgi:hypothetical protein
MFFASDDDAGVDDTSSMFSDMSFGAPKPTDEASFVASQLKSSLGKSVLLSEANMKAHKLRMELAVLVDELLRRGGDLGFTGREVLGYAPPPSVKVVGLSTLKLGKAITDRSKLLLEADDKAYESEASAKSGRSGSSGRSASSGSTAKSNKDGDIGVFMSLHGRSYHLDENCKHIRGKDIRYAFVTSADLMRKGCTNCVKE